MTNPSPPREMVSVSVYFALACAITWALELPFLLALVNHVPPPPHAMPLAGLSAFGPMFAAILVAAPRRQLGQVFGRWRTNPLWILVALFAPALLHLAATLLEVALGGHPAQWFYPPVKPEHVAALIAFSIGEEFGWRGLAYPRLAERFGPVLGSLLVGTAWGLWHFLMKFGPDGSWPDPLEFAAFVADLAIYSIVVAWVFERGGRSMWVAIAFHAGGHLDNVYRAPETEIRLRMLRFVVLAVVAFLAARSLSAKRTAEPAPATT